MTSDASPTSSDDDALAIGLLGDTLRRERHRRGWSVHVLSARAGVSFGLVSELERGKGNPSFRALRRLAEALELPLAKLVAADGDELLVRAGTGYRLPIDPGAPAQQRVERELLTPQEPVDDPAHPLDDPAGIQQRGEPVPAPGDRGGDRRVGQPARGAR
ncbi:helix-turn-helix domain-containing protein [Salana multivorans]